MRKINLTPKQKQIVQSEARFRTVRAGRRFGKTFLFVLEMLMRANSTQCMQVYAAPTREEARNIAWDELLKVGGDLIEKKNEARLEVSVKNIEGGTSLIRFMGWENKVADRFRGQKYHHVYLDEVAKMKDFDYYWRNSVRPTLIDYRGGATFASTPRGFNHFYDLCNFQHKDWEHFHFTSYDNPHLAEEELKGLIAEIGEDSVSQEILAEFTLQQGRVYQELDPDIHWVEEAWFTPTDTIMGLDYGFTHPTGCLIIDTDGKNFFVHTEFYEVGRTHDEVADWVKHQTKVNAIYPEPAAPALVELLRRKGLPVKEVNKSVLEGITKIKQLLRERRLKFHPSLQGLRREFDMYVWKENKQDEVVKEYDDLLDALRYAIYNYDDTMNTQDFSFVFKNKTAIY